MLMALSAKMRFFFYYFSIDMPSGGLKQIRLQSHLLQDLGVSVYLLREKAIDGSNDGFDDNIFYNLPVMEAPFTFSEAEKYLSKDDVLILRPRPLEWCKSRGPIPLIRV